MPRPGRDAEPRSYVVDGEWPAGTLAPDAPVSARYAQVFSLRFAVALRERGNPSIREVAREAEVSRTTVERTLNGTVLPTFGAMARLEDWLGVPLWPGPRAGWDRRATREDGLDQG